MAAGKLTIDFNEEQLERFERCVIRMNRSMAAMAEIGGMVSLNQTQGLLNQHPVHDQKAFDDVIEKYGLNEPME